MRRIAILGALLGLLVLGCDDDKKADNKDGTTPTGPIDPKAVKIALIPKGTQHSFWQSVRAGGNRAARELGIPDPVWNGTTDEASAQQQQGKVREVKAAGAQAVVLAPVHVSSLDRDIADTFKKMPVVIFDSGCKTEEYTSFIATDNKEGGRIAGRKLLALLGDEGGEVAIVRTMPGSESTTQREEGFMEVIAANPKVKVVFQEYGESDAVKSMNQARIALGRFPNLKGFYGPNESSTVGILNALREKNLAGKIRFVGFDSSPILVSGLKGGEIDALVLQDPVRMGYLGVKTAYAAIKGEKVEKKQPITPTLVDKSNMDKPDIKVLLEPDLTKDLAPRQ